jgi:hypothetical protein
MAEPLVFVWEGLEEMLDEIDRVTLEKEPYRLTGPLNEVLYEAFADTQARVASPANPHTPTYAPTGRLASSGHTSSDFGEGKTWRGEIIYDARNDQGDAYAIYELNRGGVHDFFAGLPPYTEQFVETVITFWKEG